MNRIAKSVSNSLDERAGRGSYYLLYTFTFLITAFFVYSFMIFTGRSLVNSADATVQHLPALTYYGRYLRKIVKTLIFERSLVIPQWDFFMGEGADILSTLHYYVFGDPFALLSVFVPSAYTHWLYSFSAILRLYCAGLAFSALCFEIHAKNRYGILAGAISYVFCYWALSTSVMHVYFLNPMIFFPMVIWGIERVLKGKSGCVFILGVLLACVSNFYFLYMIAILAIVYAILRVWNLKKSIWMLLKLLGLAIIGAAAAGAILVPIVVTFLQDSRMALKTVWHLVYPLSYYSELPGYLISVGSDYYLHLGFSAPVILALFLLFRDKGNKLLKQLAIICLVIMLVPAFGQFLNGMSYRANRWCWAAALLCCVVLTVKWDDLVGLTMKDGKYLFLCAGGYYILCMVSNYSRTVKAFANLGLILLAIALLTVVFSNRKKRQTCLLLLTLLAVMLNGFWRYSDSNGATNYAENMLDNKTAAEKVQYNEAQVLGWFNDKEQKDLRYSGPSIAYNGNVLGEMSSTGYYWSLTNPYITQFRTELAMREDLISQFRGYDDRTELLALASVDYFVTSSGSAKPIPFGYTLVDSYNAKEDLADENIERLTAELGTEPTEEQLKKLNPSASQWYWVYKNDFALPLGYCYGEYIDSDSWAGLSAPEKQKQMMTAVALSEDSAVCRKAQKPASVEEIPFEVAEGGADIVYADGKIITTANNMQLTLTFEGLPDSETYLELNISDFDSTNRYELYRGDSEVDPKNLYNETLWELLPRKTQAAIRRERLYWSDLLEAEITCKASNGVSKSLNYRTRDYSFSSGRTDYLLNFGYAQEPVTSVTITLPYSGVYQVESIKVYSNSLADFEDNIRQLQAHGLENVQIGTDTISGNVSLEEPMVLCLAVPYAGGWKAYVDGAETAVMVANGRYMGIDVAAGSHEIVFVYSNVFRNLGLMTTWFGLAAFAVYAGVSVRGKKDEE